MGAGKNGGAMSTDDNKHDVDEAGNDWLDEVLHDDARRGEHAAEDAAFALAVMQSLPEQRGYDFGEVARFGLSALATAVAGIIVVENGASLLDQFTHAMTVLRPDQMISSVVPFAILLGLALFTFRLQATER
jgi:hypothetical protein